MATEDRKYERLVAEETLIFSATEEISRVVEEWPGGMSRQRLADLAGGMSKAHVVRFLQGDGNPTLRTLARLAHGLDHRVVISLEPISGGDDE